MYTITESDRPRRITSVPQSSIGAPCPLLVADGSHLRLAYYLQDDRLDVDWESAPVRPPSRPGTSEDLCGLVTIEHPYAHMFGPPNDEAFSGHPLAARGLEPYSVFEVDGSSWLRSLARMNSVHPYHKDAHFSAYKHFVFSFHDETFECIAEGFTIELCRGDPWPILEGVLNEG